MILNEASMVCKKKTIEEINTLVSLFLQVCHEISFKMGDRKFYYTMDFLEGKFTEDYGVYEWLKSNEVPKNEKSYLRMMINRRQLIDKKQYAGSEVVIDLDERKIQAIGCLAAYEAEEYVVSLQTNPLWEETRIPAKYMLINEESGEIIEKDIAINNYSKEKHIENMIRQEREKNIRMISSGIELWEKRESLYPHLIFCEKVKKQLSNVNGSLQIKMIKKRLDILEIYFSTYEGDFKKEDLGYRCREESETVMNNDELREMRMFETPYGKYEFFSWHISFVGNFPGRIHFIPDAEHRIGIIGYIGKHLPTSKFKTI